MNEIEHLEDLALALMACEWGSRPRYGYEVPILHAFPPEIPGFGESIFVAEDDGEPWFYDSFACKIAPCRDLPTTVTRVADRLTHCIPDDPPALT